MIPEELGRVSAEAETQIVAAQLRSILERSPVPPNLTFLYFGLFAAVRLGSGEEAAGFHVGGGSSAEVEPTIDGPEYLTYVPLDRFLESPLLQSVKAEALRGEEDYDFYEYPLMFGAAATLAKFAMRELRIEKTLVVGFDSGERVVVT